MHQSVVPRPVLERSTTPAELPVRNEAHSSGVSWAAVIGGAFVSASLALILLTLGTGLGFSSVSPWSNSGVTASTVGRGAILWLIVTQIIASALGGYLAGRLRTKWINVHTDEVYFRDTAHGFMVWAVSMVITAVLLASAATSFAGRAAQRTSNETTAATGDAVVSPNAYYVDTLLRANGSAAIANDATERSEVSRTFVHALGQGSLAPEDSAYLTQVVSTRTGMNQADAQKRVSDVFERAQQTADATRKAIAHLSLWLFVALLSGAFCASYAGTFGGRQRDRV
ncbi:MAG: hypothetical protein WB562_02485 [Candidatus Sulfotelmatobacter sp.]